MKSKNPCLIMKNYYTTHSSTQTPRIRLELSFRHRHLWIKKSTGLGITEFFLRIMAWLCVKDDKFRNSQMCIITGPNMDMAIKLIKRMKIIFENKLGLIFQNKETVLELNRLRESRPTLLII